MVTSAARTPTSKTLPPHLARLRAPQNAHCTPRQRVTQCQTKNTERHPTGEARNFLTTGTPVDTASQPNDQSPIGRSGTSPEPVIRSTCHPWCLTSSNHWRRRGQPPNHCRITHCCHSGTRDSLPMSDTDATGCVDEQHSTAQHKRWHTGTRGIVERRDVRGHCEELAGEYDEHWVYGPDYVPWMSGRIAEALRLGPTDRIADIGSDDFTGARQELTVVLPVRLLRVPRWAEGPFPFELGSRRTDAVTRSTYFASPPRSGLPSGTASPPENSDQRRAGLRPADSAVSDASPHRAPATPRLSVLETPARLGGRQRREALHQPTPQRKRPSRQTSRAVRRVYPRHLSDLRFRGPDRL